MNCPNCGKMLELHEKKFCTGCGAELDWEVIKKRSKKHSAGKLPYGVRIVASEAEMAARIKGMVMGMFFLFVFGVYYASAINYARIPKAIGYGIFFSLFGALIGLFITPRLSDKIKSQLANSLRFIPTEGILYQVVDFFFLRFPFLDPDKTKNGDSKKKK